MMARFWSLFQARNLEYFRDRSSLAWSLLFPFLLLLGLSFVFDREVPPAQVKIALTGSHTSPWREQIERLPYVESVELESLEAARDKLAHHKVDLVLELGDAVSSKQAALRYWVSESSPQSYLAERLVIRELQARAAPEALDAVFSVERQSMQGQEVPYLEWLFPGILGMNLMFSAVFGVGFVIVRYRKNGVLKRIRATPATAFEFLAAQLASRLFLTAFMTLVLLFGSIVVFGFAVRGSYLALVLVFFWGSAALCAAGLCVAARTESEELAGGLMNLLTWPMMFLSEIWFSLEGAPTWIQKLALAMPLTHMIRAARQIMNDGVGLSGVMGHLWILVLMTFILLGLGAWSFRWQRR